MFQNNQGDDYTPSLKLRLNYWFLENRDFLSRLSLVVFIIFDLFLVSLIVIFYGTYFASIKSQNQIINSLASFESKLEYWNKEVSPSDIVVKSKEYITNSDGTYDFIVTLENNNEFWASNFDYNLTWQAGDSQTFEGSIMPNESKNILVLNQNVGSSPSRVNFEIKNQDWVWAKNDYVAEVMNKELIMIIETNYYQGSDSILDRTEYLLKNETIYNFWELNFNVILYRGSRIIGLNRTSAEQIYSGEEFELENVWTNALGGVTKIVVEPDLNFLDRNVYMPMSQTGEIK